MRAIDIWTILCYIGVFYAVMEYCLVIFLTKFSSTLENDDADQETKKEKYLNVAKKIEKVSRVLLPLYNISFFAVYFVTCVVQSDQKWAF